MAVGNFLAEQMNQAKFASDPGATGGGMQSVSLLCCQRAGRWGTVNEEQAFVVLD
jgi:hypothetical protein